MGRAAASSGLRQRRGHRCLFQYFSGALLAAVRCGRYKLRFDLDPIALYDLDADVAEQHPLPNSTAAWAAVVANIPAARDAHLATVLPVQDQLELGSDVRYALCAAPDSAERFPQFPNCTLNPENWAPPWTATSSPAPTGAAASPADRGPAPPRSSAGACGRERTP